MTDPDQPHVPIVPGVPQPPPTAPIPYYQPQSAPPAGYYQQPQSAPPQQPAVDPNAGLRKAGTVAIWVWIVLSLVPLAIIGGCFALCVLGGIVGAADNSNGYPVR